jgi:hypothetical protein
MECKRGEAAQELARSPQPRGLQALAAELRRARRVGQQRARAAFYPQAGLCCRTGSCAGTRAALNRLAPYEGAPARRPPQESSQGAPKPAAAAAPPPAALGLTAVEV